MKSSTKFRLGQWLAAGPGRSWDTWPAFGGESVTLEQNAAVGYEGEWMGEVTCVADDVDSAINAALDEISSETELRVA